MAGIVSAHPAQVFPSLRPPEGRRLAAIAALVLLAAVFALAVYDFFIAFPRGLVVLVLVLLAALSAAAGLVRTGALRTAGLAAGIVLLVLATWAMFETHPLNSVLLLVCGVLAVFSIRAAYRVRFEFPSAPRPLRPVLLVNPHSGGGKAERFHLVDEARARGIEPIVIGRGDDLAQLARDAIARGADAIAVAGGDGSLSTVAAIAYEHRLPFAAIPAGTRNHFALDLGVDRDDVVGALDAFVEGKVRWVDLAEVNGRFFVNNVSLGVYGEAVQRKSYRNAKLRTLLEVATPSMGPIAVLVSNGAYRLGPRVGTGSRPHIDSGVLGIVELESEPSAGKPLYREWTAPEFVYPSSGPIPAGIDGEAVMLEGPLQFRSRPRALQVRIARAHPGASPSAVSPRSVLQTPATLMRIALGRA